MDVVCKALGLTSEQRKKGHMWTGITSIGTEPVRIMIHDKAGGRDIPDGTFNSYVKELGFKNSQEFFDYLNKL